MLMVQRDHSGDFTNRVRQVCDVEEIIKRVFIDAKCRTRSYTSVSAKVGQRYGISLAAWFKSDLTVFADIRVIAYRARCDGATHDLIHILGFPANYAFILA